jgi:hypothetical protein
MFGGVAVFGLAVLAFGVSLNYALTRLFAELRRIDRLSDVTAIDIPGRQS